MNIDFLKPSEGGGKSLPKYLKSPYIYFILGGAALAGVAIVKRSVSGESSSYAPSDSSDAMTAEVLNSLAAQIQNNNAEFENQISDLSNEFTEQIQGISTAQTNDISNIQQNLSDYMSTVNQQLRDNSAKAEASASKTNSLIDSIVNSRVTQETNTTNTIGNYVLVGKDGKAPNAKAGDTVVTGGGNFYINSDGSKTAVGGVKTKSYADVEKEYNRLTK